MFERGFEEVFDPDRNYMLFRLLKSRSNGINKLLQTGFGKATWLPSMLMPEILKESVMAVIFDARAGGAKNSSSTDGCLPSSASSNVPAAYKYKLN